MPFIQKQLALEKLRIHSCRISRKDLFDERLGSFRIARSSVGSSEALAGVRDVFNEQDCRPPGARQRLWPYPTQCSSR